MTLNGVSPWQHASAHLTPTFFLALSGQLSTLNWPRKIADSHLQLKRGNVFLLCLLLPSCCVCHSVSNSALLRVDLRVLADASALRRLLLGVNRAKRIDIFMATRDLSQEMAAVNCHSPRALCIAFSLPFPSSIITLEICFCGYNRGRRSVAWSIYASR